MKLRQILTGAVVILATIGILALFFSDSIDGTVVEMNNGKAVAAKSGFYIKKPGYKYFEYPSNYMISDIVNVNGTAVALGYQVIFPVNNHEKMMSLANTFEGDARYYDIEYVFHGLYRDLHEMVYYGNHNENDIERRLQETFDNDRRDIKVYINHVYFP